jgi:hypothetical protein
MPTVFRSGPYRFFFYAGDFDEPPHVHVERDDAQSKFWLTPCSLASNNGFHPAELRRVGRLIERHATDVLEQWHEFFGSDKGGGDPAS